MNRPLQKVPRSALRATTMALWQRQGRVCAICGKPIDITIMGRTSDYVVDHDHNTGEIRGVLHRSCNAAEGKVSNAAGSWGAKSKQYSAIILFLEQMVHYLKTASTGMMYPDHKSAEEKHAADLLKQRKARAAKRAKDIVNAKGK